MVASGDFWKYLAICWTLVLKSYATVPKWRGQNIDTNRLNFLGQLSQHVLFVLDLYIVIAIVGM